MNKGVLYIVATPIGNLKDITLRALDKLKKVDLIACEDTRTTKKLLKNFNIKTETISLHQHSRLNKIDEIINRLNNGKKVALVTDSGTPAISDPGSRLIRETTKYDKIKVVPIPGPSALTTALSISGAQSKNILFLGFIPHKKRRKSLLREISIELSKGRVVVFYESPHRIKKTIGELKEYKIDAKIVIARELTKKFEDIKYTTLQDIQPEEIVGKGEFTVIIYP